MEAVQEMLQFLELSARVDVKTVALQYILGLTGSPEGQEILSNIPQLVNISFHLTSVSFQLKLKHFEK